MRDRTLTQSARTAPVSRLDRLALKGFVGSVCAVAFCLIAAGCSLSPLAKHAAAFSKATTIVTDGSEDAYRAAIRLRHDEQVSAAVFAYDKNPQWSPYTDLKPLLTPDQLSARITVLDALKAYAQSLVVLTGKPTDKDNEALETAAAGAGTNLKDLNQTIANLAPGVPVIGATAANSVSTAVDALAKYLIARKVTGSLPKVTQDMNQYVTALCELLDSDIVILRRQADVDYQTLITDENQMILHAGTTLNPIERRDAVGRLVTLAEQQKANDMLLAKLQKALHTLALTHQALAAAVQGNNPESIRDKITELAAAGQDLGNFYKSLPTS